VAKRRTVWRCQQCGNIAPKWLGRCSDCGEYGTFVEEIEQPASAPTARAASRPIRLAEVVGSDADRVATGIPELDRVLGGGLVSGSLVLLGGQPGIGKSTLLLQAVEQLSQAGAESLYVCGEESPAQVKLRARRLGALGERLSLLSEVDMAVVEAEVRASSPAMLVVDSIQTMFDPELSSAPGSVGQVRACTARLMRLAKERGVTTLIVGHVTKEGAIAGPRVLEHMVDTVLYFEGDRDHAFRVVRAEKNRFGPANEVGIFEMTEAGLSGVAHAPGALLPDRTEAVAGSAVFPVMEGTRPLLVEVQALVTPSYLQVPRRLSTGIDTARLLQVLAVLERRAGMTFGQHDVYVSVAGGVRVVEPAVDLPLALALASARRDVPVADGLVTFGELGLTGEVRPVSGTEARLRESARLGFTRVACRLPRSAVTAEGIAVSDVQTLKAAVVETLR